MLIDARTLPAATEINADICVVGSGAAGITLARALQGRGLSVCVLEAGGFEVEDAAQDLYVGQMSGIDSFELAKKRWRLFGGSTSNWAGWCMPMTADDFEVRPGIPDSGWPISLDDLQPYYARAQEDLQLADFLYDATTIADLDGLPLLTGMGRCETRVFQYSPPTRMGEVYRPELAAAADVSVYHHANATELVLNARLDQIERVEARTLAGGSLSVVAGRYVLAMGGIENVRLLLASDAQVPTGVANGNGLVGCYFMEHPHLYSSVVWLETGDFNPAFYDKHTTSLPHGAGLLDLQVRGALSLSDATLREHELLGFTATITETSPSTLETGALDAETVAALTRTSEGHRAFLLSLRAEQTPYAQSRVTLTEDVDALGMRRVDLNWAIRDSDLEAYARGMDILGAELAHQGRGRLWTPLDSNGRFSHEIAPGGHHMGTTRMSSDPTQGVVDSDGRSHEVNNLYLAGSSVFSTGGAANPTLTIVALAERLATHLGTGG
jgi:choline dehydrogenase-like flavoprotein